ncbi:MAG: DUF167 domain-containing protein [Candidatus Dormibacteria bacterium]
MRVHPKAATVRRIWDGNTLSLWVLEPPERGAANAAVITAVAQWLHVSRRAVRMRSGRSGRTKLIEVVAEITLPAPDASFT